MIYTDQVLFVDIAMAPYFNIHEELPSQKKGTHTTFSKWNENMTYTIQIPEILGRFFYLNKTKTKII